MLMHAQLQESWSRWHASGLAVKGFGMSDHQEEEATHFRQLVQPLEATEQESRPVKMLSSRPAIHESAEDGRETTSAS